MNRRLVAHVLSRISFVFTLLLLIPLLVAFFLDWEQLSTFVATLLWSALATAMLRGYGGPKRPNQRLKVREGVALVGCAWFLVCFLGALPYFFSGLGLVDALFESVSGFTTTGITVASSLAAYPPSLLSWRFLSHWAGGLGVILLFITILPQINSQNSYLFNTEICTVTVERTLPKIREAALYIFGIYLGFTLLEIVLFLLGGVSLYDALNLAFATMSTGGFLLGHGGMVPLDSWYIEGVCLIFMLIASMNFSLYYKAFRGEWKVFREETEYKYYLGLLGLGTLAITANLYMSGTMGLGEGLWKSLFHVVSIGSTTGLVADDLQSWTPFSHYMLLILLFVGGCSGSTAGGVKVSRLLIMLKASWAELLRSLHPRIIYAIKIGPKEVEPRLVVNITRFFFLYMVAFIILTIAISLCGLSTMESIGIIATSISNAGPAFSMFGSTSIYSQLPDFGRVILIIAMLLGRLEIFTLLLIFQPDFWHQKSSW